MKLEKPVNLTGVEMRRRGGGVKYCADVAEVWLYRVLLYFALWFLSFFLFFSSSNLNGRRLDVYTWYGPSANLECRSEMCCTQLAGNAGPQNRQKFAIWAPSHNFVEIVGIYLCNEGTYRQSEKNLLNSNISPHVLPYTIWRSSAY